MLRQRFLEAMSRAASTVSVVTTDGPAGRGGSTVSAMASLSADSAKPSLLVCVNSKSQLAKAVLENGVFCVNVLGREQAALSDRFAGRHLPPSGDKFEGLAWSTLTTGAPALGGVIVAFDCRLAEQLLYATHWVLIGEVEDIIFDDTDRVPLLYHHRAYKEPSPLPP